MGSSGNMVWPMERIAKEVGEGCPWMEIRVRNMRGEEDLANLTGPRCSDITKIMEDEKFNQIWREKGLISILAKTGRCGFWTLVPLTAETNREVWKSGFVTKYFRGA